MSGRFFFAARDQALWQPRVSDTESQIPIGEFSPPPLLPSLLCISTGASACFLAAALTFFLFLSPSFVAAGVGSGW